MNARTALITVAVSLLAAGGLYVAPTWDAAPAATSSPSAAPTPFAPKLDAPKQKAKPAPRQYTLIDCSAYADGNPVLKATDYTDMCVDGATDQLSEADGNMLPRCINDDYNDGTQPMCWSQRVTDGMVFTITADDVATFHH